MDMNSNKFIPHSFTVHGNILFDPHTFVVCVIVNDLHLVFSSLVPFLALVALPMFVLFTTALPLLVFSRSFLVLPIRVRVFVLLMFGFVLAGTLAARFSVLHGKAL